MNHETRKDTEMTTTQTTKGGKGKKSKGGAGASTPQVQVEGKLEKMREQLVREALVEANLGSPDAVRKMALPVAVKTLTDHYRKTTKQEDLTACDNCDGVSDLNLDTCPFCGYGDQPIFGGKVGNGAPVEAKPEKAKNGKAELAKASDAPEPLPEGVTAEALDAALEEVAKLKREGAVNYWHLGKALADIHERQLWKARADKKGAPIYKSWNQFCDGELEMTPANAYNAIDVAKHFTEKQLLAIGQSKLAVILRAPEDKQPKLLEIAQKTSFREVQQRVTEAKQAAGGHRRGAAQTGRKKVHAPANKAAKSITVASILKDHTVALYCRPEGKEAPSKRAKKIGDVPVGWLELERGIKALFTLVDTDKGLALKVRFKRGE